MREKPDDEPSSTQPAPRAAFSRDRVAKLAAEFAVIFVSIILALIADDWRENRSTRAEERRALELIARDLHEDRGDLQVFQGHLDAQARAAALFFAHLPDRSIHDDSLVALLQTTLRAWNYRPAYPAYKGLLESGRLYLVSDVAVRETIIEYFDETLVYLDDMREQYQKRNEAAHLLLRKHLGPRPDTSGSWRAHLSTSRAALSTDAEALNSLAYAAQAGSGLRGRIDRIFLPENAGLEEAIRNHLARGRD